MVTSGSDGIAKLINGYGLSHVFVVPSILTRSLVAMDGMSVTPVTAHAEKAAAYMADGYARARRMPAICMAQTIGAANLAAGLKDAEMACSPVVAITGGPNPNYQDRKVYQEIDDFAMFGPVTKLNARVDTVTRFPEMLRQAFRVATTGRPGPVHLQLRGHWGQGIENEEADLDLRVESRYAAVPPYRPAPDAASVESMASVLQGASRPVIVAGGGVVLSDAQVELVALAEKLSIPVATSLNAKGTIADDHRLSIGVVGLYSRKCVNQIVSEADLIFYVGSQTGSQVTNQWKIPGLQARVAQLDIDPEQLGRHYVNVASMACDAKVGLTCLLGAVEAKTHPDWEERVAAHVAEWRREVDPHKVSDDSPMRPERVCQEISRALPAGGVVVCDTGHSAMWSTQALDLTKPGQRFIRCAGSLGWGLPAAIGVKAALPDTTVIGFTGDGGFYYHLSELETAARYGINVVVVVNNNDALSQEQEDFDDAFGDKPHTPSSLKLWHYTKLNLATVAEGLGCIGLRAETPSELADALEASRHANRPVLIDAHSQVKALAPIAWSP
jgi:acetolactate synthase-1/2/3 large subunit